MIKSINVELIMGEINQEYTLIMLFISYILEIFLCGYRREIF